MSRTILEGFRAWIHQRLPVVCRTADPPVENQARSDSKYCDFPQRNVRCLNRHRSIDVASDPDTPTVED